MAIIFMFSSIPSRNMPSFGSFDLVLKKGGHMLGYALLAQAYLRGIGRKNPRAAWLALGMVIIYAASDELHQSFVTGRGAGIIDVGIDGVGGLLSLLPSMIKKNL
jgi:VanZ family protein